MTPSLHSLFYVISLMQRKLIKPPWLEFHPAFGHNISATLIADSSHQAASGVLNEKIQGDDRE